MWSHIRSRLVDSGRAAEAAASAGVSEAISLEAVLVTSAGWLVRLRWLALLAALFCFAGAWVFGVVSSSHWPVLAVAGVVATYNALLAWRVRTLAHQPPLVAVSTARGLVRAQVTLDLAGLTLFLYFSGGLENPFVVFYMFHIIIASIFLSQRHSTILALLASAMVSGMALLEYTKVIPRFPLEAPFQMGFYENGPYLAGVLFALVCVLLLSTYLTADIAHRYRVRDRELLVTKVQLQAEAADLQEANRKLEKITKTRSAPTLLVAHELRAPLAAIQGLLDAVLRGYIVDEAERQDALRTAKERSAGLIDVVSDLLCLGQIREMGAMAATSPVDLPAVLNDIVTTVGPEAALKGLDLAVSVEDNLPPARGNREQLAQLLFNLVDNAIKYTPSGGRVTVSLRHDDGYVTGEVRDTGIGIEAGDLGSIFDDFYRAENAKQVQEIGTGLGLGIVKRVIELHAGRLTAQSRPGEGTAFIFSIPVSPYPAMATPSAKKEAG